MQKAFVTMSFDARSESRLLHRSESLAGALGAARRAPAGNGYETPGVVRHACIAIGQGVSLS
jgi:hypothetical protein